MSNTSKTEANEAAPDHFSLHAKADSPIAAMKGHEKCSFVLTPTRLKRLRDLNPEMYQWIDDCEKLYASHTEVCAGYDKVAEMARRKRLQIPETANTPALLALAEAIRLEAVYRQKYLKRRFAEHPLLLPEFLTPDELAEMFLELLDKYDLKRDIRKPLNEDQLMAIPRRFRTAAMSWQHGYDVLKMLDNNKTEYSRCHGYLLSAHSINIYGPPPMDLEERVELGDILSPENFVPVPAVLRADPELFFSCDMSHVQMELDDRVAAANR